MTGRGRAVFGLALTEVDFELGHRHPELALLDEAFDGEVWLHKDLGLEAVRLDCGVPRVAPAILGHAAAP